jgi:histidinol phosphatase-like PHP family hydrolase
MLGYKRAAAAVLALDQPLTALVGRGTGGPKIPGIGPAAMQVISEVLGTGTSDSVEQAVGQSGLTADIGRRRWLRGRFLSRAAVLGVLGDDTLQGPEVSDYRGDLQLHSACSDGEPRLEALVEACIERRYTFAAVTDHSYGLKIAGGLSMPEAAAQRRVIDHLNDMYETRFRLIRGIEANIASSGGLDLCAREAAQFELVLAAPHSGLRNGGDQTDRLIAAIRNPHVNILAHPRGRISGTRSGLSANWEAVFSEAARHGVAIEIDGDPARQDLDYSLAARAFAAGCVFAVDSDAHTTSQLRYVETALAHARLASIPSDRIVNCWPTEQLLAWLSDRRLAVP